LPNLAGSHKNVLEPDQPYLKGPKKKPLRLRRSHTYKVPKKTAWAEEKQYLQGFQNLAGSLKNVLELDQQYLQGLPNLAGLRKKHAAPTKKYLQGLGNLTG
jgi:hypothetical protein